MAMKNVTTFSRRGMLSAVIALGLLAAGGAQGQTAATKPRIGVYDSRAVAVAFANSTEFRETIKSAQAEHEKAKAAKDDKQLKAIETTMKLRQKRLHEQGFSTGSVLGIMAQVKDKLPGVARQAGVQAIVSKFELNYQSTEVEVVDVTDALVALFHVSDKGKEWAKGIQAKPPVPLEELGEDVD